MCSNLYRHRVSAAWAVAVVSLWMGGGCRFEYETLPQAGPRLGAGQAGGGATAVSMSGSPVTAGRASQAGSAQTHVSGFAGSGGITAQAGSPPTSASALGGNSGTAGGAIAMAGANGGIGNSGGNTSAAGSGVTTCRCTVGQGCVSDVCTPAKIVFTTSQTVGTKFGGISGADQICANAALNAHLPGQYLAWLSASNTDPATRFVQSTIPYALVNATVIANDWADLIDGTLAAPMDLDENGEPAPVAEVWTGTQTDGTRSTDTCDDWSSASASSYGLQGVTDRTDPAWTDAYRQFCDRASIRLMCFQQ